MLHPLLLLASLAPSAAVHPAPPQEVTRQDLAALVQVLDARLAAPLIEGSMTDADLRAANERFDRISLRFFAGRPAAVRDELVTWLRELDPEGELEAAPRRAAAPLSRVRRALEARLDAAEDDEARPTPLDGPSLRVVRSRLALLVDDPSPARSREFLLATPALAREVADEARRLLAGERPYRDATGDLWRTVAHGDRDLAVRVWAPPRTAAPPPLVVAFHGAGGDENFLFELGGDGHLKRLAERDGFLVACPATMDFMLEPEAFDSLLEGLARDHAFDPRRVLLVGHSMGTAAVSQVLRTRGERVAGAVCIAGFSGVGPGGPPVLAIVGEVDPIARPDRIRRSVESAREAGGPVTLEVFPHQGHTLLLPAAMDRALAFFDGLR